MERLTASPIMEFHRTGPIHSIPVYVHDDDDEYINKEEVKR
jgi:hypothetical protein